MVEIPISTVDKLHLAFTKLETVTYLASLFYVDICEEYVDADNMNLGKENAASLLLDLQREAVDDLHKLLFSEPFC